MLSTCKDGKPEDSIQCRWLCNQGLFSCIINFFGFLDESEVRKAVQVIPNEESLRVLELEQFTVEFFVEKIIRLDVCNNSSEVNNLSKTSTLNLDHFIKAEQMKNPNDMFDQFFFLIDISYQRKDVEMSKLSKHCKVLSENETSITSRLVLIISMESFKIIYNFFQTDHKFSKKFRNTSMGPHYASDMDLRMDETNLLEESMFKKLSETLPSRCFGQTLKKIYCTKRDGYCLKTLYSNCRKWAEKSRGSIFPCIIVVKDTEKCIFGALLSEYPKLSTYFYGSGETALFTFRDNKLKVFNWTGKNDYFILCRNEFLSIGSGDGKYGLYLDKDLNQGYSQVCETFANEILSSSEYFRIALLEVFVIT